MRIVLIIVVALLTLATAAFVVDPTSGPVATQFVSTYFMPPITWVVSKTGFNVANHGLYLIIGLGIVAFILINRVFNRLSAAERDYAQAQIALGNASKSGLHEHLANMTFEQRLTLIEDQASGLERELSRLENADDADDSWRERVEAIGETIKELTARQDDRAAAAKFSGVIAEIEHYVSGSHERLKQAIEASNPEHIQELGSSVAAVSDELNDLREHAEPLKRFLESARDIDRQITQFVQGEGGITAMLREAAIVSGRGSMSCAPTATAASSRACRRSPRTSPVSSAASMNSISTAGANVSRRSTSVSKGCVRSFRHRLRRLCAPSPKRQERYACE